MTATDLLFFLPAAALIAASPGANNLLCFTHGAQSGLRATMLAMFGRIAAFAILIALAMAGLGKLLETSATAFAIVKWIGVVYLAYLGVRFWRTARFGAAEVAGAPRASAMARREFLVALTNPKALLLFAAFLPQFVDPASDFATQFAIYGAVYLAVEYLAASLYAAVGARLRRLTLSPRAQRRANKTCGAAMLGMAGALAASER
ncbi:MAG: LysE family translocator [Pseudomonadota bacterium]